MRKAFLCGAALLLAGCGDGTGPGNGGGGALDVGGARVIPALDRSTLRIEGGSDGGEYVLVPFYADSFYTTPLPQSGTRTDTTQRRLTVNVTATGIQPIGGVLAAAAPQIAGPLLARAEASGPREDMRFHLALRQSERAALASLRPGEARAAGPAGIPGARFSTAAAVPQVGDVVRYNTNAQPGQQCSPVRQRTGRVVTVSQRAVIVADQANPVGGFTDAEYAQFGTQFDNLVYPVDEQHFGAPNDIDKNSRVVIFFTSAVNDLTPVGSQQYVGGFFYGRDLFPVAASGAYPGCVGSNEAEMFYMLVPDPARAGGNADSPFAKARVASQTIGVLAHEFQHLINLSRRNLQSDEDVWLNEGLSHIAEELMFYRVSGLQSRANITITQIASGAPQGQAFSDYQNANFNRLNGYLRNPETNSPYADNDSLTTRGATWQMLRYLVDRKGGDQATTLRALVGTQQVGLRNLRTVFGEDPLALVRDYTVAVYADDASFVSSGNLAARYEQPSWNYRAIFPRYTNNNNQFPLKVRTLSTAPVSFPLAAGGAAYLRFAVPANGTATITTTTGNGAAVPTTLQMTLLRTK